jgi:Lycopene cyclase protein
MATFIPRYPVTELQGSLPNTSSVPEDVESSKISISCLRQLFVGNTTCLVPEAYWRDILAFTDNMRTFYHADTISNAWPELTQRHKPDENSIHIKKSSVTRNVFMAWIESTFEFNAGADPRRICSGLARFVIDESGVWRVWSVSTMLEFFDGLGNPDDLAPAVSAGATVFTNGAVPKEEGVFKEVQNEVSKVEEASKDLPNTVPKQVESPEELQNGEHSSYMNNGQNGLQTGEKNEEANNRRIGEISELGKAGSRIHLDLPNNKSSGEIQNYSGDISEGLQNGLQNGEAKKRPIASGTSGINSKEVVEDTRFDVVVVGAGPAGLAMAGRLKALGIKFITIEKYPEIGNNWTHRYDCLKSMSY